MSFLFYWRGAQQGKCIWYCTPGVGSGHSSFPLSIYFLIFCPFYFSLSIIGFTYFLLLSIPSLSLSLRPAQPSIPSGSVNEYQVGWEGKGRYGSFRWRWMRGVQVKLWDPLRTPAVPECLRGMFTTRRYTNPRLPCLIFLIYQNSPTRFLARGRRKRPNLGLVCFVCVICIP